MGHPPAPDVMMVMSRLSRRRLGHLGVGWGDLRGPGRLSATSFLTRFSSMSQLQLNNDGDAEDSIVQYWHKKLPAWVYKRVCYRRLRLVETL